MRVALMFPMLLLPVAGCQAEGDMHNNQVTLQYNAEVAENALEGVTNEVGRFGEAVANEFQQEGARADDRLTAGNREAESETPANAN